MTKKNLSSDSSRPPLVRMQAVYKYFARRDLQTAAVNGVDLEVQLGEFVAIMGPSGSGKSSLLRLIGLLDRISRGTYHLAGKDVSGLSRRAMADWRKGRVGFIFQSFNLIEELDAYQNIALPLQYLKVPAAQRQRRVDAMLDQLGLQHRRKHRPRQLSGGEQQRVAIGRALVISPDLILADEPTGKLDSEQSRVVMETLRHWHAQGTTIVMATHAREDAAYAERIVEMFDGKVLLSEKSFLSQRKPSNTATWPPKHS